MKKWHNKLSRGVREFLDITVVAVLMMCIILKYCL